MVLGEQHQLIPSNEVTMLDKKIATPSVVVQVAISVARLGQISPFVRYYICRYVFCIERIFFF
jgi:hypothetical protein